MNNVQCQNEHEELIKFLDSRNFELNKSNIKSPKYLFKNNGVSLTVEVIESLNGQIEKYCLSSFDKAWFIEFDISDLDKLKNKIIDIQASTSPGPYTESKHL